MRTNDIRSREDIRAAMQSAIKDNDSEAFTAAFEQMLGCIEEGIRADYAEAAESAAQAADKSVLTARGVRQLTTEERNYYQRLGEAMQARDPKQALANLDVVMPETVITTVFDELQTRHPLLRRIEFLYTGGAIKKDRIDIYAGGSDRGNYVASFLDASGPAWVLVRR